MNGTGGVNELVFRFICQSKKVWDSPLQPSFLHLVLFQINLVNKSIVTPICGVRVCVCVRVFVRVFALAEIGCFTYPDSKYTPISSER